MGHEVLYSTSKGLAMRHFKVVKEFNPNDILASRDFTLAQNGIVENGITKFVNRPYSVQDTVTSNHS